MELLNVSSGRIDTAVFLLPSAIGEIASRRGNGIGWDIGHRFSLWALPSRFGIIQASLTSVLAVPLVLLGGGSHGLTVIEGVLDGFLDAVNIPKGDAEYRMNGGAVVPLS